MRNLTEHPLREALAECLRNLHCVSPLLPSWDYDVEQQVDELRYPLNTGGRMQEVHRLRFLQEQVREDYRKQADAVLALLNQQGWVSREEHEQVRRAFVNLQTTLTWGREQTDHLAFAEAEVERLTAAAGGPGKVTDDV